MSEPESSFAHPRKALLGAPLYCNLCRELLGKTAMSVELQSGAAGIPLAMLICDACEKQYFARTETLHG